MLLAPARAVALLRPPLHQGLHKMMEALIELPIELSGHV
jgi:hypothetical protein